MRGPVQSLEVTYLVHATEDPERLSAAVSGVLGVEGPTESEKLEGHFGNQIIRVRFHLTGDDAERGMDTLSSKLSVGARALLMGGIDARLDEHGSLFFRLDKQKLVRGSLELGEEDPVRVKVKPRAFRMKSGPREFYAGILGGR